MTSSFICDIEQPSTLYYFMSVVAYWFFRSLTNIELEAGSATPVSHAVSAIVAFSKGFACASGPGTVHIFEKSDDKEFYRKTREIQVQYTISIIFIISIGGDQG